MELFISLMFTTIVYSNNELVCKSNELQEPLLVKIINDQQLYVVDCAQQLAKIFDTQCNAVGTINTSECPKPFDVAQNEEGFFVAGDAKGLCVWVCSKWIFHPLPKSITIFTEALTVQRNVLIRIVISLSVIVIMVCMYSNPVVSVLAM